MINYDYFNKKKVNWTTISVETGISLTTLRHWWENGKISHYKDLTQKEILFLKKLNEKRKGSQHFKEMR